MNHRNIPAISIIIPMYNAEKYIGECLDSILAQTFDDYEVIVVDHCSTDNSASIVESYIPKSTRWGGATNLQLINLKTNSGSPSTPRNIGMKLARGEYISFIDSDDLVTRTAYEELYNIAKKFNADVVHCERYYQIPANGNSSDMTGKLTSYQSGKFVGAPTLLSDNFGERVADMFNARFLWNLWSKLIRRDFLFKYRIEMVEIPAGNDMLCTCFLICSAPRYVRVPNVINIYRVVETSITNRNENVASYVHKWFNALAKGVEHFDKFLNEQAYFVSHPDARQIALETVVKEFTNYFLPYYRQIPAFQLDSLVRAEIAKITDKTALTSILFAQRNIFHIKLIQQQQLLQQQQQQIHQLQSQIQQLQQLSTRQFNLDTEDIFK